MIYPVISGRLAMKIERTTAGVDWISVTLDRNANGYQQWRGNAIYALESVAKQGYMVVPRRLLGYEGLSAGNCFVGANDWGGYAQFTGEKANYALDYLCHAQAHCSRLDVQVTAKYDELNVKEGKRCYRGAMDRNKTLPEGRRRKIWIIIGSDGGDTCYIGSPSSEQRARIYNKEVQSEDILYTRCWRYEVVFRNTLSTELLAGCPSGLAERAEWCVSVVTDWLAKRGVSVRGLVSQQRCALPIERTLPTDTETKLKWLNEQVKPTIGYLTGVGLRDAALEALGISINQET
jgi:hypothetical protein